MKSVTPNIMTGDMNRSIQFYKKHLGFRLINHVPDSEPYNWAMMKNGDVVIMFQTKESLVKEFPDLIRKDPGANCTLYIQTTRVEELYMELKDELTVVKTLEQTFYKTKEFSILDCHGIILTFSQDI